MVTAVCRPRRVVGIHLPRQYTVSYSSEELRRQAYPGRSAWPRASDVFLLGKVAKMESDSGRGSLRARGSVGRRCSTVMNNVGGHVALG